MLTLLMVMLVGLFTVGCGDSGEDFVVTGNNGQVPTGNVTFQFARAQNVATVPTATQKLLFTFFNAAGQSTGSAGTAFANTVTLAVPVGSTRATVQALGANDAVLATVNFTFTVLQGQTVTAVPTGGGTTGGTTGNTTGGTTGNTTGGTTGNTTGGTTGNTTGGTTGNTTGGTTGNTTGGTTGNTTGGTAARLVIDQSTLFVAPGATTPVITGTFFAANSTVGVPVPVGQLAGVPKNPNPAGTTDRWTFNSASSDVTASGTGGLPAENNSIQFTLTHTPVSGPSASQDITVTAVNGADPRLAAVVSSQLLGPTSITLPSGAVYPFVVVNTLGNGTRALAPAGTAAVGDVSIDPSSSVNVGTFNAGNTLTAAAVPATGTVTLRRLTALPGTFTPVATVNVNVVNTTLKSGGVANVILTPSANAVRGGSPLPYKVEWLFENNSRLDVTSFYAYTNTGAINAFAPDAVSGLANGVAPTTPVAVLTASTIGIGGILGGLTPPPGVPAVNAPDANVNVTP